MGRVKVIKPNVPAADPVKPTLQYGGVTPTDNTGGIRLNVGAGGVYILFSFVVAGLATSALYYCPAYGTLSFVGGTPANGFAYYFEVTIVGTKTLVVYTDSLPPYQLNYSATILSVKG